MSDQQQPPQPPFDFQKWVHEMKRQDAQRVHDTSNQFHTYINTAAIETANLTLRMAMLINGGAAVALLSFVAGFAPNQKRAVADSLVWFAWGVVAAVVGLALAYFTNYCMVGIEGSRIRKWEHPYIEDGPITHRWRMANRIFHVAAVIVGLASIVFFVVGMFQIRGAIKLLG